MLLGHNLIGFNTSASGPETLQSFSTIKGDFLPEKFYVATEEEVSAAVNKSVSAFKSYSKTDFVSRALFLETIADQIYAIGDVLLGRANLETGLPLLRLTGERDRTVNQLKMFASLLREGSWADAVIDTAMPDRKPLARADLRRMSHPLGPVVIFSASNFPFAFSTAGGDTASALAAGCPVIIKAHSSHLGTNELIGKAIIAAAKLTGMPDGIFSSLNGGGATLGQRLARDTAVKAIGFTGSYRAGMALFNAATQHRKEPIPVYAEMSSINPVIFLPDTLTEKTVQTATQIAGSISLGVGQFCTNPGLLFVLRNHASETFINALGESLSAIPPGVMLNTTICQSYYKDRRKISHAKGVEAVYAGTDASDQYKASTTLYKVDAADFITQPELQDEVFGPCSMVVICNNQHELEAALDSLHGQLTGSVFGNEEEVQLFHSAIDILQQKVGRIIFNAVPTGVEVCHAMVHGGPFPATTDSRTTSVGTEAIRRFVRPVCYQDCPQLLLPVYLRDANETGIMRKLNGVLSREPVSK